MVFRHLFSPLGRHSHCHLSRATLLGKEPLIPRKIFQEQNKKANGPAGIFMKLPDIIPFTFIVHLYDKYPKKVFCFLPADLRTHDRAKLFILAPQ